MLIPAESKQSRWCIVSADDHGPDCALCESLDLRSAPVQFCRLGESSSLLHRTLRRAASIASTSRILVTVLEDYRERWEPMIWAVRPELRFVCGRRAASVLATWAAILSIANTAPSSIVTLLPARCYVGHDSILIRALREVADELPYIPEGAATLGMLDLDEGVDEDYLVVGPMPAGGPGLEIQRIARRPTAWVARHLRRHGAVVASGIMVGYADVFAAHISKHWPGMSVKLIKLIAAASAARAECEIPDSLIRSTPDTVIRSMRWHPSAFPQRVFTVCQSGWSGLHSAREISRIAEFYRNSHRWARAEHAAAESVSQVIS